MEGMVRHRTMEVNGISMHVAETGPEVDAKGTVLFVHGFPELWYSWRHQMEHLAARGYRCVAPDLRGYGGTSAPSDIASYTAFHIVGDLIALLDALGLAKQVFVLGHDWGALIAWYLCVFRPERVTALVNTSVTFMRSIMIRTGPGFVKPTDYFNSTYGPKFYMCRFQVPGVAEKQFAAANAKHLVRQVLCHCFSHGVACEENMDDDPSSTKLPSWLTEADVDYFGAAFEKTGFTGAINYYRNLDRNCELAAPWSDAKVRVPTKFIVGTGDIAYNFLGIQDYLHNGGFKEDVPLLEELVVIPGAGHFVQQEKAQEVSDHIYDFITKF
ncbi:uncharacterized protein LOC100828936 isoform X1 [Brachypodium distachyon]|uniref:uncharacterized protein LOC100828936 isoform X1 n=1 Tax=Brachypodium distachyon TaxID=15368 RepID=UPI0006E4823C|nr:uncharacterized protein LOC100828936 isoform X1 [Brachypodium distachyon]XP_024318548.1 uncharacterized protein LOC100828936 isoform X1 [Brachypodium distachyon]|eukprot:XP_024318547.1 uncharacterized protein LOC100828936 isoform X1 [Brachypodium distachyon]